MNDYDDIADLDTASDGGGGFAAGPLGLIGDPGQPDPAQAAGGQGGGGLLPLPADASLGAMFSTNPGFGGLLSASTQFPGAAAAAPGGAPPTGIALGGGASASPSWVAGLQPAKSDLGPPLLQPQPGPLLAPAPGATPGALQWLTTQANDPTVRYDPKLRTVDRATFDPSAPNGFAPMSPDQLQMFKEQQLGSDSYPPGVKSPQEISLDRGVGDDGTPPAPPPRPGAIGPRGYVPQPGDANLLRRVLFAESGNIPGDMAAIGWTGMNRIGKREFGSSLSDVVDHGGAYQSVDDDSPQWRLSGDPSTMNARDAPAWKQAGDVANGILSGRIPDPTGGAVNHFSSPTYDGDWRNAPGPWFPAAIESGALTPSPYRSTGTGANRNYFFLETPRRPRPNGNVTGTSP